LTPLYKREVKNKRPKGLEDLKEALKIIDDKEKEGVAVGVKEEGPISKKKNKIKRRLCYKCRMKGHIARNCKVVKKKKEKND
jgi:hypothetical protein